MAGRMRGGRGFGRHGRGGGRGNFFRAGRMLADGDLRLIALRLLADGPRHGYDIIKALEERSSGFYAPSPGVVYPTLTFLEEAGYAASQAAGSKRVYSITEEGRAYLEENRDLVEGVLAEIERFGRKMARAREWLDWMDGESGHDPRAREGRDMPEHVRKLKAARHRLRETIAVLAEAPHETVEKAVDILNRAADDLETLD